MWTYSGIFIEKRDDLYIAFTDNDNDRKIFSDENGHLRKHFKDEYCKQFQKNGLYQALTGYGAHPSDMQDPLFYDIRFISKISWNLSD